MIGTIRTRNVHLFEILIRIPYHADKLSVADPSPIATSRKTSQNS